MNNFPVQDAKGEVLADWYSSILLKK